MLFAQLRGAVAAGAEAKLRQPASKMTRGDFENERVSLQTSREVWEVVVYLSTLRVDQNAIKLLRSGR